MVQILSREEYILKRLVSFNFQASLLFKADVLYEIRSKFDYIFNIRPQSNGTMAALKATPSME